MKTKILDTNVILDHSIQDIIESFAPEDSEIKVVVPFKVLVELDTFKKGTDPVNGYARLAIRFLDSLRALGNLSEGIIYKDKFIVQVHITKEDIENLDPEKVDNNIVLIAKQLKEQGSEVEIVTRDLHERVLADVLGVIAKDISVDKAASDQLYTGIAKIDITDEQLQWWYSNPTMGCWIPAPIPLYPNQFVEMKDSSGTVHYGMFNHKSNTIIQLKDSYKAWGIKPKKDAEGNTIMQQSMLMQLLLDPEVEFVSAIGSSGTGKTVLALACALEQILGKFPGLYDKIVVMRPMVGVDKDIGALPGTKDEKLEPWMGPIFDNLEFLLENYTPKDLGSRKDMGMCACPRDRVYELIHTGKLELEAITFIRGRSMPRQFIIIDDAQNLSPQQAATIITRAGEGSKVVFLGDVSRQQIDDKRLTPMSNGLAYTVDRLKGTDSIIGHVTMTEVVRSRLAMLGVKYL